MLTTAGERFLTHVQGVLDQLEQARSIVHDQDELTGTLTISANEVLCAYRLPGVFHLFRSRYPGVQIVFRSVSNLQLKQTLFDGTADIVFMLDEPIRSSGLTVEPMVEEQFRFFAAPDHRLANRTSLQLADFHDEVFLTNEKGCTYRSMFDRAFEKEGIDTITHLEFQNAEAIKQCAMARIGIAFLPEVTTKAEVERNELVALPWNIPDLHVYTQMLWHKDKWLSPILSAFIGAAREVMAAENSMNL